MKISVLVKTGSKKGPLIEAVSSDNLVVFLHEKPHDNEANIALIRLLAEYFGVAKSCISIIAGQKSHRKVVEITK